MPILGKLHSVRPNAFSQEGMIVLRDPKPFIIGFYRGNNIVCIAFICIIEIQTVYIFRGGKGASSQ